MKPLITVLLTLLALAATAETLPLEKIKLPPGFAIELWARVDNAREMALGRHGTDGGTVFVGSLRAGKVHAVRFGANLKVTRVAQIAEGLQLPAGVAYRAGSLYVSAVSRILRYDDIEARLDEPPVPSVVTDKLPSETHHGGKFIAFGPDGKLYVPVGAACATASASTGSRRPASYGSPTTDAICSATTRRPTSSTTRPAPACILATHGATAAICPTRNTVHSIAAASSPRRRKSSPRTRPRWACAFTT
jgi:glucose/arabinose dehydrogenase